MLCRPGCIFQNYGTVGIGEPTGFRVLSGRSLFRSLSILLPLCNENTGPVTPALIFRGVTESIPCTPNELEALARAWVKAPTDPILANHHKRDGFTTKCVKNFQVDATRAISISPFR
ncbi:hypothetical protein HanIR_Chr10g0474361 [Helianthus annuus]|nr:hypothetical protein HanIR_Chr10g0474361 [Helianthus annuus]